MENELEIMLSKIRLLMTKERLNIKNLSELTKINYSTLRDFLAGKTAKVDASKVSSISKALKCDIEYLTNDSITEFIPFSDSKKKLYYLDEKSAEYAQKISRNEDLKMLFEATQNIKKEDMEIVYNLVKKFQDYTE